jgi:hypothetical protein
MPVRQIYLKHKTQTKCNDCWYASIQMLKTWQADGVKTKPSGTHTKHLHAGIVGHRLRPDSKLSKHFKDVLKENGLITLGPLVVRLTFATDVLEALETYGPLMVGGDFGTFIGVAQTWAITW